MGAYAWQLNKAAHTHTYIYIHMIVQSTVLTTMGVSVILVGPHLKREGVLTPLTNFYF